MPKTKHTAAAPDGSTFTRTSENRTYTHMITGRRDEAAYFATADRLDDQDRRNFDYYAACAAGTHEHVQPTAWRTPERCTEEIAEAAARIGDHDRDSYAAALREHRLERHAEQVAAGFFTKWLDLGWCGRLDLAQKAAATAAKHHLDVQILEARRP